MNKIEVKFNTKFYKPYCPNLEKRGFIVNRTSIKLTHKIKKEKRET